MKVTKKEKHENAYEYDSNPFSNSDLEKSSFEIEKVISASKSTLLAQDKEEIISGAEKIQKQIETTVLIKDSIKENFIFSHNKNCKSERESFLQNFDLEILNDDVLRSVQHEFSDEHYSLKRLEEKLKSMCSEKTSEKEKINLLVKAASELTSLDCPLWEMIAARFRLLQVKKYAKDYFYKLNIKSLYEKIKYWTINGQYGDYILNSYTETEVRQLEGYIKDDRDNLFNISGLDLLLNRYLTTNSEGKPIELPQEMFLGISMHLAIKEKQNRLDWVKRFYDMLSTLKVTMATPTLSNARKPLNQLSSCFIDTVPDSLDGIYRSIDNFAKVSKFGGGMGLYFGKVRANGSDIRGHKGAAGGIIRWIKLANDTAIAVDQLGVRKGAVAVYLDVWHKDLPEFLMLRTNNGDDRMKAHDIFPAVCYPDYFWEQAKKNVNGNWYLMCPHEVKKVKGYSLEDFYGQEWLEKYISCIEDSRISKRVIPIKDVIRLILKSAVETGTPFVFNRDTVNKTNPNKHKGMIYCSNLCTEIAQNMSPIEQISQEIKVIDGEQIVVSSAKSGDFVVCNLASLSLGRIDVNNADEIYTITKSAIRALDNVVDLNFFPVPYAKITSEKYRPIGLGVSGYHHMLAKNKIYWESSEHLKFIDKIFEDINYAAIDSSCENAIEKGKYEFFEGSSWQTGEYFDIRNYNSERWKKLKAKVKAFGIRNGYLLAIAPTSSTSIISGTSAGVDPIMSRYFLEEKKDGLSPRVAPELSQKTFWYYKNSHIIDQKWSLRACGVRQRHIDQSQSVNLYITNEYTFSQILNLYILAWEEGVKTIYYVRSKSLEVEDCDVCSS